MTGPFTRAPKTRRMSSRYRGKGEKIRNSLERLIMMKIDCLTHETQKVDTCTTHTLKG